MASKVVHLLGSAGIGGQELQLKMLLESIDRDRYEPELILFIGGPLEGAFRKIAPTTVLHKAHKVDPVFFRGLVSSLKKAQPLIVHTWGPTPNLWGPFAARIAGVPHLVVSEGSVDLWKGRLRARIDRRVGQMADAVTGNAIAVVEAAGGRGVRRDRLRLMSNGVQAPPTLDPQPRQGALISLLGRINPYKGHDVLLRALPLILESVPNARVEFAGAAWLPEERAYENQLRTMVGELGLEAKVTFRGSYEDPGPILRASAVAVLPSYSEGLPNVLLEALAYGAPVVATSVAGIPEVIQDGVTGLLVPCADPAALARAVVSVLQNPRDAAARAAAGRRVVAERFSAERMAELWADLYDGVVGATAALRGVR